jgi:formate hydrogenlyase subunit 3/multisubunit Na+/H+ antiporter MnhD subunit
LIPTLFLILGWVYQPERVQAGIYLLFYTLLASLPLLVGILFIYNISGSLCLFSCVGMLLWLVGYFMFVWFLPFWLGCL